jgi:hypothetical protein
VHRRRAPEQLASLHKERPLDLFEGVRCPQLLLCSKDEPASLKPGGLALKTWAAKPFGALCASHVYSKQHHGWMTRGSFDADRSLKPDYVRGIEQLVAFYAQHLVGTR